jgi:hypothetical protein
MNFFFIALFTPRFFPCFVTGIHQQCICFANRDGDGRYAQLQRFDGCDTRVSYACNSRDKCARAECEQKLFALRTENREHLLTGLLIMLAAVVLYLSRR